MGTFTHFRVLLMVTWLLGLTTGTVQAQPFTNGDQTENGDGVSYDDFLVDGSDQSKAVGWGVWTLSGLGVASLGIGTALYIAGRSDLSSLEDLDRDNEGRIRNITQRNAARMEEDVQNRLNMGKGYILGGIALGAIAVTWYYFDTSERESLKSSNDIVPFGRGPEWDLRFESDSFEFLGGFTF